MSVTTNTLGANSRQIVINNESSADNIISAISAALTTLGWTLIDTVTTGANNMIVKKVFSAPNADSETTPTTKYMILRFDTPKGLWYSTAAEYWDVPSHTATNETFHNDYAFPLSLQYGNNVIYIFASARYAAFATAVRSELGPWQGVFEFEREAAEDIAGQLVPCFGWTSALTFGSYYGSLSSTPAAPRGTSFWVPRTIQGYTGWAAAQQFVFNTAFGTFPPPQTQINYSATNSSWTASTHLGMIGGFGNGVSYSWDTGKKIISSVKLAGASTIMNAGRIYGIKVTPNFGAVLDTTTVPVDSNGFFQAAGSNTNHYVFPITGGFVGDVQIGANRLTEVTFNSGTGNTIYNVVIYRGRYVYAATNIGIFKLDQDTAAWIQLTTGAVYYIAFDGKNTLYGTASGSIIRLNMLDDTYDSLTISNVGANYPRIAVDENYLYVAQSATTTTPVMNIVNLATFTVERTYTSSWSCSTSGFSGLEVDYNGNVFCRQQATNGTQARIFRIAGATAIAGNSGDLSAQDVCYAQLAPSWIDFVSNRYYTMGSGNSYTNIICVNTTTLNTDGLAAGTYYQASYGRISQSTGTPAIVPFKGYHLTSCFNAANYLSAHIRGKLNDLSTTERVAAATNQGMDVGTGSSTNKAVLATDGVFLFSGTSMNSFSRIGNQAPGYNNQGTATARVLFKA